MRRGTSAATRPEVAQTNYSIPVRFLEDVHPTASGQHDANDREGEDLETPVIVFINPKSGGKLGPQLLTLLHKQLGKLQVLDISDKNSRPDVILKALYNRLDGAITKGDPAAQHVKSNLRIIAAGGDGTVAWVLSSIRQLEIDPPPPVGVIPLGTGNGISVNFGWGKKTPSLKGRNKADKELDSIAAAEVRPLDGWTIDLVAQDDKLIDELPNPIKRVKGTDAETTPKGARAKGLFWYYLTVGLDAEVAYRFHTLRQKRPWLSPTRKCNIFWYMWATVASGWFCCPTPLNEKLSMRMRNQNTGEWTDIVIPNTIEAIIFINLQSYTGSRDLWGLHDDVQDNKRGEQVPIYDDGALEVIGLQSAGKSFLALTNLWRKIHGVRLAQGSEFELSLARDDNNTHMRVDGEPWFQDLPDSSSGEPPLKVVVKLAPPARVLVNTSKLPEKNKTTRLWSDAAGTAKSGISFKGDHVTVVSDEPKPQLKAELAQSIKLSNSVKGKRDNVHILTHHL